MSKKQKKNHLAALAGLYLLLIVVFAFAFAWAFTNWRDASEEAQKWKDRYWADDELRYAEREIIREELKTFLSGEPIKAYRVGISFDITLAGDSGTLNNIWIDVNMDVDYELKVTASLIPRGLIRWSLRNVPRKFTSLSNELTDIINAIEYCDSHYVDAIEWRITFGTEELVIEG